MGKPAMFGGEDFFGGSLFGGRGGGSLRNFGGGMMEHMQQMSRQMDSMFENMGRMHGFDMGGRGMGGSLLGGMGGMGDMASLMNSKGNGHSCMQSSSYSYSSHGDGGKPRVIEKSTSHRQGAGQVSETQDRYKDSKTGVEQISMQRKIGNRARKVTRGRNMHDGSEICDNALVNISEAEASNFDSEWNEASRNLPGIPGFAGLGAPGLGGGRRGSRVEHIAGRNSNNNTQQRTQIMGSGSRSRQPVPLHTSTPSRGAPMIGTSTPSRGAPMIGTSRSIGSMSSSSQRGR